MNILFYRYGSVYEPDMIDAFKAAGLNVIEINNEIDNKDVTDQERISIIRNAIETHSPVFVYGINYYPAVSEVCRIYNTTYISQTVDSPIMTLFDKSIGNSTNRIMLFDRAQFELFAPYSRDCIFHLPLASAVDRFDKIIGSIKDGDRDRFKSDISFVGSTYREKDPFRSLTGLSDYTNGFVDALIEASLKVYGYYPVKDALDARVIKEIKDAAGTGFPAIADAITDMDAYSVSHYYIGSHLAVRERERTLGTLARFFKVDLYTNSDPSYLNGVNVHPGVNTLTEMPKVFNLSRINLNMTMRPIETGLPLRCFDILGCGGFLMTNYQPELEDMFVLGQDLEAYSSLDELIDKCSYYLDHEDERAAIAQSGYEKVKASHTHYHRLKTMLSKCS